METAGNSDLVRHTAANVIIVPVNLGATALGSLGFSDASISATAMQSIANLVAMSLDRARKQEVAAQAEVARRHQELKSMLLDALAHEFQTPLTSIRTGVAAMLAESPGGEQREWLEIMDEESARLSSMMVEAIQMARIEAGHVDLDKQTHTVDDLVHSALEKEMEDPALIQIDLPQDLPPVSADAGLIRLVIRQIVGNALKYSQGDAPIRLTARVEEDCVAVSIADRGPGIPPEEQQRIFDKYYRGQQGRDHLTGMGLGLPIARTVVEAHDGRIWVESRPGEGATFSFTLPFAHEEASV
jgi:two-component system sensor histidine kinase KdpD